MSTPKLPASIQDLAEVIGEEAALALANKANKRKLYVPASFCNGHIIREGKPMERRKGCCCKPHWIHETIGEDKSALLIKTFSGCILDLASFYALKVHNRRERIRYQYGQGAKVIDLMREHSMSKRGVEYAIRGYSRAKGAPKSLTIKELRLVA